VVEEEEMRPEVAEVQWIHHHQHHQLSPLYRLQPIIRLVKQEQVFLILKVVLPFHGMLHLTQQRMI
jgi:hypothetical protein